MVRQDIGTLASLLADDLSYTHSDGRTDTKESLLSLIAAPGMRYLGVDYSNQDVIDCGDAAVVRGVARIRLLREPAERPDYFVLFLDVWVRRDGRWQTVAWQATRLKPEEDTPRASGSRLGLQALASPQPKSAA